MRRYPLTEEKRQRWIKDGRGTGRDAEWRPWLRYEDVPSKGNMHRFKEGRHGRMCTAFSDTEFRLALYLDFSSYVANLYDQWPHDLNLTRSIAKDLGVDHPRVRHTGIDMTMSTDWVAELNDGSLIPFSVKYSQNLSDFNDSEHLEIERLCWERQGSKLWLFTEDQRWLSQVAFDNLKLLHANRFLPDMPGRPSNLSERLQIVQNAVTTCTDDTTSEELCKQLVLHHGVTITDWLNALYHLVYRHKVCADVLTTPLPGHSIGRMAELTREQQAKHTTQGQHHG